MRRRFFVFLTKYIYSFVTVLCPCIPISFFFVCVNFQLKKFEELSKQPDIYEKLARSLAPNIWELDDVKKGLLCQVV